MDDLTTVDIGIPRGRSMLSWDGKHAPREHAPPALEHTERWGEAGAAPNLLFQGDNRDGIAHMLATGYRGQVKLVYIDPPFDSGADYVRRVSLRGPGAALLREHVQYTDTWSGDSYLQFMYERLLLLRDLLRADGALYLHCNTARSHHLRVLLDEVFGPENFRNEIVVRRIRKNIREHRSVPRLNDGCDSVLFYANGPAHRVHPPEKEQPQAERWHAFDAPNVRPNLEYPLFGHRPPPGRHWLRSEQEARAMIERGDLRAHARSGRPEYRIAASTHVLRDSLWDDVTAYAFGTGYPTEKKPELLKIILGMSSDPGDLVLDAFVGSGTTLAVAQEMGRRWIGMDTNPGAIHTAAHRLGRMIQRRRGAQATLLDAEEAVGGFDVLRTGGESAAPAAEARVTATRTGEGVEVRIESFRSPSVPDHTGDWRQTVDAVLIDPDYSGGVFRPKQLDVPERRVVLVAGRYLLQAAAGKTLAVKMVDVLGNEARVTLRLP